MLTTCTICLKVYDDVYRWTYCPHDKFAMHTGVTRQGKPDRVATTVEELERYMHD